MLPDFPDHFQGLISRQTAWIGRTGSRRNAEVQPVNIDTEENCFSPIACELKGLGNDVIDTAAMDLTGRNTSRSVTCTKTPWHHSPAYLNAVGVKKVGRNRTPGRASSLTAAARR